jgi:hypothetical protein
VSDPPLSLSGQFEFMRAMEGYAELGVEMVNIPVFPGNSDPVGFVSRLGDEVVPRLASLG